LKSIFVIGDTHFGHEKLLSAVQPDGSPLRPFSSAEEMDEALIENWNSVVTPSDTVYHLGDVCIPRSGIKCLLRCNGRKILFRGNHDSNFKLKELAKYFDDIRGCFYRDGVVFSHFPVHPSNLKGPYKGNVHGHLHCHLIYRDSDIDRRYFNSCVERNNFTPVSYDTVKKYFELS
jgi:calcineurin-like phosphoesterase family protein